MGGGFSSVSFEIEFWRAWDPKPKPQSLEMEFKINTLGFEVWWCKIPASGFSDLGLGAQGLGFRARG